MNLKQLTEKFLDRFMLPYFRRRLHTMLLQEHRVWGDPGRLKVAKTAILNNTLFNTVSGTITVEEHAFFGHNVSVLTGTHDISKANHERQNSAPGFGRDVVIGQGAWIASSSIILGPCKIGKHAVVGAGAVVCQDVPDSCVVAGVPAKVVRKISNPTS